MCYRFGNVFKQSNDRKELRQKRLKRRQNNLRRSNINQRIRKNRIDTSQMISSDLESNFISSPKQKGLKIGRTRKSPLHRKPETKEPKQYGFLQSMILNRKKEPLRLKEASSFVCSDLQTLAKRTTKKTRPIGKGLIKSILEPIKLTPSLRADLPSTEVKTIVIEIDYPKPVPSSIFEWKEQNELLSIMEKKEMIQESKGLLKSIKDKIRSKIQSSFNFIANNDKLMMGKKSMVDPKD